MHFDSSDYISNCFSDSVKIYPFRLLVKIALSITSKAYWYFFFKR